MKPVVKAVAAVAAAVSTLHTIKTVQNKRKRWRNRRWWTREWIRRRELNSRDVFSLLTRELQFEDQESFKKFLRMNETSFHKLLDLVKDSIRRENTVMRESISPQLRLAVTLRFLASGDSYRSLSFSFRIPPSTLSGIIPDTCQALCNALLPEYLKMPDTEVEWLKISEAFNKLWNYPNCVGALDGKHVQFQPPKSMGSHFFNYKGFHSIVLLAVVDANLKFVYVDVGCNGRISDGGVYKNSRLQELVGTNSVNLPPSRPLPGGHINVPFHLVADDAFPLTSRTMKPFKGRALERAEKIFNYRLSRARRTVENAFGVLSNRFRLLQKKIELSAEKTELVVMTACALHNFLAVEDPVSYFGASESQENLMTGVEAERQTRPKDDAKGIRECLKYYFNNDGAVPWQDQAIERFNF